MNRVAQHPLQAFLAALTAVALLSIMDAVMKHLVIAIGIFAVVVWRALLNLGFASVLYLPRRLPWPTRATLKIHVGRGILITVMAFLFFWGLGRVPIAQAIALTFIAPLIALMLAALFLGEKVGPRSITGSIAASLGVLAIVLGQARAELGSEVLLGSAAILGSAVCYAANIVVMRHQSLAAKPLEINFFQSLTIAILWLAAVPLMGVPEWPREEALWLIAAAVMSTVGGMIFSWAYARAEASYLAVTEYSAFIWAVGLGWVFFDEPVSIYTWTGAALIVGGCLIAVRRPLPSPPEMDMA